MGSEPRNQSSKLQTSQDENHYPRSHQEVRVSGMWRLRQGSVRSHRSSGPMTSWERCGQQLNEMSSTSKAWLQQARRKGERTTLSYRSRMGSCTTSFGCMYRGNSSRPFLNQSMIAVWLDTLGKTRRLS